MCLNHTGPVEESDFTFGASWTDDTKVHVLQPQESCYAGMDKILPYARAKSFIDSGLACDCQGWPDDNGDYDQYQINNPCKGAPYTTSVTPSCTYV